MKIRCVLNSALILVRACSSGLNPTQHETNITMYIDYEAYEGDGSYTYFIKRGRDLMPT